MFLLRVRWLNVVYRLLKYVKVLIIIQQSKGEREETLDWYESLCDFSLWFIIDDSLNIVFTGYCLVNLTLSKNNRRSLNVALRCDSPVSNDDPNILGCRIASPISLSIYKASFFTKHCYISFLILNYLRMYIGHHF